MFRNRSSTCAGSSMKFDFNQAVADARSDYPEETKNTTFIPVSTFRGKKQIEKWFNESSGITDQEELRKLITKHRESAKHGVFCKSFITGKSILSMSYKGPSLLHIYRKGLGRKSLLSNAQRTFDHELGHAVMANTSIFSLHPKMQENVADAFSLLRGFQQGTLDKTAIDKLQEETHRRAYSKKFWDQDHEFVPIVANKVRAELENVKPSQLMPQKVKEIAQNILHIKLVRT